MMNKNLLNEELDRIKLLYGYKTQNTLDENKSKVLTNKIISERFAGEVLKSSEVAAKELAMADRVAVKAGLESAVQEIGKITILDSRGIPVATRNTEEILLAMKEGRIAAAEMGKLAKEVFKTSTSLEVKSLAMDIITNTKSFDAKFAGKTRETIVNELMSGPGKYTKAEAENLANNYLKKKPRIEPIKAKEPIKTEPIKAKEPIKTEPIKGEDPKIINNNNISIQLDGGGRKSFKNAEEFFQYQRQEGEAFATQYKSEFDALAQEKGYKNFEEYLKADESGAKAALEDAAKTGKKKGIFSRALDWAKRTVKWKTIFGLAKIAGGAWLIWYLFFKENGKKVECPEGQKDDGKGNCVPDGGGGGGGGGGDNDDGKKTDDNKKTDDTTPKIVMDVDGNKYTECEPPYYKGCVAKKGNDDIKTIQDCLGVTPNGFFNQETEDALKNKINKKSFTKSDIPSICARSYGASNFSY